ncbi:FKBP-type peptidyl-prolyl cis-trans isomerase [Salmonella enterica subsp. enterica]|uniref:FKBP-type peptidyl-prolyl cis-trans isomerase n=1 Tax=Salmonella enterica I TaxID=59201 RepID=A0A447TTY8_SALET|nr:FKBP-type peptidyl-prolyl cis-trans isomerase [Salmonella enterica subsp. enterica]
MKVAKDLVVSLAYQVRTEDGVLVDESPVSAPLDYLHGPRLPDLLVWKPRWKAMKLATNLMSLLARTTLTASMTKNLGAACA